MEFGKDNPLFGMLRGRWRLSRAVEDRLAGLNGRFDGVAAFLTTAEPNVLAYHETGTLSFGPFAHAAAERRYRWIFRASDRASVQFEDGRFFHRVQPVGGIAEARHECGRDVYEGRYVFEAQDRWHLRWQVSGPRKDYTMDSTYTAE